MTFLQDKLKEYYKQYYFDTLRLRDWEERYESFRKDEEESIGKKFYTQLTNEIGIIQNKKILIVGAGTGAEGFFIHTHTNCQVTLLEPDSLAIEILKLKCEKYQLNQSQIFQGIAEALPFDDNSFDLIICYTVLEHVQDYKKSLLEMNRCLCPNGPIILQLPNYSYPEEPHYKIKTFPPAQFTTLARLHLKIIGRYTPFFDTLNFLTTNSLNHFFKLHKIKYRRISERPKIKGQNFLIFIYTWIFNIERNQKIIIQKF